MDVYEVLAGLKQKSHYNRDRSISEGTITEVDCNTDDNVWGLFIVDFQKI